MPLCAPDFRVSIHLLVLNLKSLNFLLLFLGREKERKTLEIVDPGVGFEKGRFDAP